MKRMTWLCLIILCTIGVYSQGVNLVPVSKITGPLPTVQFCAGVETNGYCDFNNTKFITAKDSTNGRLFMEVKGGAGPIGAEKIIFKIYKVDNATGKEKYESMLSQDIKPDWFYSWMPYVFNSPGKYTVKIYNESDSLLCTNSFELIAFK